MYISIKSTTFFETQSFMVLELQLSNFLQYNDFVFCSYFKWRHNRSYWKIRLTPVKGIHVNNGESVCAIASHKIHVLMKFIEIDETSVNLLHNYSKSDPQKPQKFQSSQETLHVMFRSMLSNLANAHLRLCLHLLIISVRLFNILFPL